MTDSSINSLEVAKDLNQQATNYCKQEQYDKAEPLVKQALAIYQDQFGHEHLEVADTLDFLAVLYHFLDRYEERESPDCLTEVGQSLYLHSL